VSGGRVGTMSGVDDLAPPIGDDWLALVRCELPVADALAWAVRPSCGAMVSFTGTTREVSGDRTGVWALDYEAYGEQVVPAMARIAAQIRSRHRTLGRLVMWHREGRVALEDAAVLVVASAPHRGEAFAAAREGIDELKATVPIWKLEHHDGGSDWSEATCGHAETERVVHTEVHR
jgi:molybdopterin synthase catalytic subunit